MSCKKIHSADEQNIKNKFVILALGNADQLMVCVHPRLLILLQRERLCRKMHAVHGLFPQSLRNVDAAKVHKRIVQRKKHFLCFTMLHRLG